MGLPNILSRYISFDMNENNILKKTQRPLKIPNLESGVPKVPRLGLPPFPSQPINEISSPQLLPTSNFDKPKLKLSSQANLSNLNSQPPLIQPRSTPPAPPLPVPPPSLATSPKDSDSESSSTNVNPTFENKPSLFFIVFDLSIFLLSSFLIYYFLFLA